MGTKREYFKALGNLCPVQRSPGLVQIRRRLLETRAAIVDDLSIDAETMADTPVFIERPASEE